MSARPRRVAHVLVVVLLCVVATACRVGGGPARAGGPPATPGAEAPGTPAPGTPAPGGGEAIAVELGSGGGPVTLDNGWVVQRCEGDAPLLCVLDAAGATLGVVEFGSYPASDAIAEALARGTVMAALEARVAEQHAAIAADRAIGCGAEYEYRAAPVGHATVGQEPAVVYAFSGVVDGREVERHRSYYTVHAGQLWVVTAAASDPEGCMATDLAEFTPADLVTFEPFLARIVAGTELPDTGTAIVEGMVAGVDGGLDGGLIYVLWDGGKQRIAQPAALTEADLEGLGLAREPAVAQLTVTDSPGSSRFVVVPPDGPDARLHLVADGVVREVLVQHVAAELLEGVPELHDLALSQVRPARSAAG